MAGIRQALLLASAGRYIVVATNLGFTVIIARLLTPAEYGISVLGTAVFAIAEAIRGLGSCSFLVQQSELTLEKVRTTFTVNLLVTVVTAGAIILLAGPTARYFATPGLEQYLQLTTLSYLMGPFMYPTLALMSREMDFGAIILVSVVTALLNAAATLILVILGFSYMSFAWAGVISGTAAMLLVFQLRWDLSNFRPSLSEWRGVLAFGAYDSAISIVYGLWDYLPFLILGRVLNAQAVGVWQRTMWVCLSPEKVILAGFGAVALPVFSQHAREGRDLKDSYLGAIEHITAVQWPALIFIVLLPHPIISILLGRQWLEAVPLVQIAAGALLFYFPVGLHYPTLVSVGAIRHALLLVVALAAVSITVLWFVAGYGLHAVALSLFLTVPFNVLLLVLWVRFNVPFRWGELAAATRKSAVLSALTAVGPAMIVIGSGWRADLSLGPTIAAVILGAVGWIGGVWLTRHPLLHEVSNARDAVLGNPIAAKALGAVMRLFGGR